MEKKYREPWEFPKGIDNFEDLITSGCVYVDKTDLVYQMIRDRFVFLSRPRRFGKSLLCSTLKDFQPDILKIDSTGYYVKSTSFDHAIHEIKTTTDVCTLMYQLGFLTIKNYDRDTVIYILGIPNDEVRSGLTETFKPRSASSLTRRSILSRSGR